MVSMVPMSDNKAIQFYIKTYGCQMNVYDSSRMKALLKSYGGTETESIEESNIIILNTCNIREKATEKVYSDLGRIKKMMEKRNRKAAVIVSGCVAQAEGNEIFKRSPWVDIVVGPQAYHKLPELISSLSQGNKHLSSLEFTKNKKFEELPVIKNASSASEYVTIQEGCNKFCKYCVVPYTRGREFSRPFEEVYNEILQFVEKGAIEIFLLGQNVNAYRDKSTGKNLYLVDLLKRISEIKQVKRIRYMTSHPIDMSDDLIEAHGYLDKLMPQLHLPVQSGSDAILKHMNRLHTIKRYMDIMDKLKKAKPNIRVSSDIIVGYPGETEEDFQKTLDIINEVQFSHVYSFKYSPRPGTPAARLAQIPEDIKKERLKRLQDLTNAHKKKFNEMALNQNLEVLVTNRGKRPGQVIGFSHNLHTVTIDKAENYFGKLINVKINKIISNSLIGEILSP
jgi:tRNA-2-methylthio-N6-dimethylallyladenosine synthase